MRRITLLISLIFPISFNYCTAINLDVIEPDMPIKDVAGTFYEDMKYERLEIH